MTCAKNIVDAQNYQNNLDPPTNRKLIVLQKVEDWCDMCTLLKSKAFEGKSGTKI